MKMHVDTTLIDATRHILSVIRDHNAETERERRKQERLGPAMEAALARRDPPRPVPDTSFPAVPRI